MQAKYHKIDHVNHDSRLSYLLPLLSLKTVVLHLRIYFDGAGPHARTMTGAFMIKAIANRVLPVLEKGV